MNNLCPDKIFFLMRRSLVLCLMILCIACFKSYAQLETVPVVPVTAASQSVTEAGKRTEAVLLQLPFFDDFSTTKGFSPDTSRWLPGGGIFVTNTFSNSQPSVNMVVFDGLNSRGIPYSYENIQIAVPTDTLTSRPVDLSKAAPADSVYLSFYVQPGGLVEMPDETDTLLCEFLRADGSWQTAWKKVGAEPGTDFFQVLVAVKDKAYFHAGFQFRFVAYGRQTGAFDVWLLDYIYLDKNRRWNDTYEKDATVTVPLTSYLKRFTSMPASHYLIDPAAETASAITAGIYNLHSVQNVLNYEFVTTNASTGQNIFTTRGERSELIMSRERQFREVPNKSVTIPGNNGLKLKHHFKLITSDEQNPPIQGVDLRQNDTLSFHTDLTDYFAYDDGSAEYGVRMNRRLGKVAVRYVINKPDTLAGVKICFVPFLDDVAGQSLAIHVYDNDQGLPGNLLYQQSGQVSFGNSRDEFVYLPFQSGVAVSDTFFIGWLQTNEIPLNVGYDRNSTLGSSHIFANLSQDWYQESSMEGSLMIRPVTGGKPDDVITGNEPVNRDLMTVYPNPSEGIIHWKSEDIVRVEVTDISGRVLKQVNIQKGTRNLLITELQNGLYFVRLFDGMFWNTQKVLLRK